MPSIEQLEKLRAADPQDTFVLYALAQAHAGNGDHETAIGCYDQCLAVDPHYCYAYFHKARAQEELGHTQEAIATLRLGLDAARSTGDDKAQGEIEGYLDALS